ncbi:cadherin domain-containing protein [Hyphococcus luteus]|uniref:Uncharacterized protein n=1 Tax=Hyphococcus luteus TaxID=2058213 RepID=A0A2S7K1W9_9PROT|nr:cadherin domain-containing protein [Marinicaulis flavus]PQA86461.1 hypothetical protein CW354_19220 [Marinicaulis flavus]
MAKDKSGPEETPKQPGSDAAGNRQGADFQRTHEDDSLESDRESLKKAREIEDQGFDSDAAADGYGNLHFGDQNLEDAETGGAPAQDGENISSVIAGAAAPQNKGAETENSKTGVNEAQTNFDNELSAAPETNANNQSSLSPLANDAAAQNASGGVPVAAPAANTPRAPEGVSASQSHGGAQGGNPFGDQAPVNDAPTDIVLSASEVAENAPGAVIASLEALDPDLEDASTFTIVSDESGLFEIVGDELKLKDGAVLDYEAQDNYVLTLRATDSAGNVFDKTVTLDVTDVNEAPEDLNLSGTSLAENADGAIVATLSASDPDAGDTATFAIADDPSGLFEVVGDQLKLKDSAAADFEQQDSYELTLRAADRDGAAIERTVTINVADVNEAPTDISLSAAGVAENDAGATVGTLSVADPDIGDSASYAIAEDASGLFEVVGDELRLKPGVSLDHEARDSYDLTLRVTDGAGNSFDKPVTVSVADINETPTDIALSASGVAENDAGATVATLSAVDPDIGDSASYAIAEDASGLFEIVGDELRLKPGLALDHEARDSYDLTLRVTDGAGNSFDKPVTISVADVNETPTDITLSATDVAENDAGATVGTLSVADPDVGDSASYAIAEDASGLFEVVGDELRLKPGVALDHETQESYDLTLRVTDGAGNGFDKPVTISVADINETPTDIMLSAAPVAENDAGAVVGTLSAMDPDFGDSASFAIADDPSGLFEVVGDEVRLKAGAALDFESQDSHDILVEATDSAGNVFGKTVTINVADVNEAPGAISLSSTDISENADGAVVGTLSAVDPDAGDAVSYTVSDDRFEVVGDELKLKPGVSFDYETAAPIDVTVTASDAGGLTSEQNFTLTVTDANEGPSLGLVSSPGLKASYYDIGHSLSDLDEIDFNAPPNAESVVDSIDYMQGQQAFWDGAPGNYFAAKYEGQLVVNEGGTYTFSMASDDGSMLFIDGEPVIDNDGLHGTRTDTMTVDLEAGAHDIEVRYFENTGSQTLRLSWSGPDTGGATEVIGGEAFEHGYSAGSLSVAEDTAGAVVAELTVADPDAGDSHAFAVSDDRFEVVNEDGTYVLKLKDGESLDYESEPSVDLSVTVTDSGGASDVMSFSVGVENVNSAPEIALQGGEGLKGSYYNIGHSLSDLDQVDFNAAPDAEGVVDSLNYTQGQEAFWDGAPGDYFAAKYEGQVMVGEGGAYTFSMASDDGSMLFIDGEPVLDNDGLHSTRTRTVTVDLDEGAHDIEVRYFENGGEATLQLSWAGPDTGGVTEVIGGDSYRLPGVTDEDRLGVTENTPGDHAALLSIADPDGDAVSIAVSDDRFEVVEDDSGYVLKLKDDADVNYEEGSEINVTVTATDAHGESASESFDIPVADLTETPTDFALSPAASPGVLSLNRDGGGDDAAIASDMAGFPTDALTVEVAFASDQTDVGNGAPLFSYAASDGSDNEALLWMEGSSGKLHVFLASQKINTGVDNASLLDGEQHQVSFTWDQASNELKVYVDGETAFETSVNIRDLKSGGSLVFGQEQDSEGGGFNSGQVFEGEIAEVRIFDYARSGEEIAANKGAPIASPDTEPGLVNNWVMNAETGGVIEDLVGADDLSLQNGAYVEGGEAFDVPTVVENQPGAVAGVLSATDPDNGGPVTEFAIVDDPSGAFEIVGNEIRLKDGVSLNHETQDSHDITVEAISASGDTVQSTFTVAVGDIDEAPVDFYLAPANRPNALALNTDGGVDDGALAMNLEGFPTDALTVEVAFASDQTDVGAGTPLFSYAASDGSNNEALLFLDGGSGDLNIYIAGQSINTGVTNASLLDGDRHQVSFTWDQASNELKLFVDGETAFETSVNIRDLKSGGSLAFGQEQDSEGGSFDTGQVFEGEIYEARIFDYARSPEEIADHAGRPLANPDTEPGLVNNWVMTSAPGGEIEDLAGADNLQLVNGADVTMSALSDAPMVVENDAGAVIGTLAAADPETGGAVTQFVIADDPSGAFEIVGDQLKLKDGAALDYETQSSHQVTVNAVGAGGETTLMTFTIDVADVEDYNVIEGAAGADTLRGTAQNDMIAGGAGDDVIRGRNGDDILSGDEGNDNIRGNAGDDVIAGGDGNDVIRGDAGADELSGGAGDDRIYADGADTSIDGGEGYDRVVVQGDEDFAINMAASNVEQVHGGAGSDAIDASSATESVRQYGRDGDDVLTGGAGDDVQRGGAGDDVIAGGAGNDVLRGDAGADALSGGAGDDRIYADGADTSIDGGEGYDRVIVQGDEDFAIDMAASNVEQVHGGAGSDAIDASGATEGVRQYGRDGDDALTGGAGDDVQRGGAGDDVIAGGDGNDVIRGDAGADELSGGAGDDRIYADGADTAIDGGEGYDRVIVQGDEDFSIDMAASNVEQVHGGAGSDAIDASGATEGVRQYGRDGDDALTGGAGDDVQRGGAGDDVIAGGAGDDVIRGDAGADELSGGAGDDRIYADGADTAIDGGEGYDRVIVQGDEDFSIDMAASNVEQVHGGAGSDAIDASGATESVRQYGRDGDDVLTGGTGDDVQRGGEGNDVVSGGAGDDVVRGDAGDDVLTGGEGDDRIYGGDGEDMAVFSGNRADYTIEQLNDTAYRVIDNRDGTPDGTDRVYDVEHFEFADQTIDAGNILNEPPTDISLEPALSTRAVGAEVSNGNIATADGGGSGVAGVNFGGAVAGTGMVTLAFAAVDNSFELLVNGESLTGRTVQLQSNVYDSGSQAFLQFEDGSAMTTPWTASADGSPRVIVQVTENGVDVMATRTPDSTEYESMTLVNGAFTPPSFLDGDNTVTVVNPNDDGPDGLSVEVFAEYDEAVEGPLEGVDGAVVGTLSADDADASGAASFAIADDPSGLFEVAGDQLKVKDGVSLDYDSQSSHEIVIEATDDQGAIYQETVTVNVQEVQSASEFLFGGAGDDVLEGGAGDDFLYGGGGDDVLQGGAGDDFMSGGDGSDVFVYEMGDGNDHIEGGAGAGWTDTIQLQDGATPVGELGTDWTVELSQGSVVSSDEHGLIFSEDADGVITLADGSTIDFADVEQVTY